ncbi:MAG: UPF0146 family protein [Halorubrum sp.]
MLSPPRQAVADELDRYDRLLEVGIGGRPGVARTLAHRGRHVVAVDLDVAVDVDTDADVDTAAVDHTSSCLDAHRAPDGVSERTRFDGSLRIHRADVVAIAEATDPVAAFREAIGDVSSVEWRNVEAVYALNLPAELQRPTVTLAAALDADCLFTTLGFETPVVATRRRSLAGETVFVPHGPAGDGSDETS